MRDFRVPIRGVFAYGASALVASGRLQVGSALELTWEPTNPHDRSAIRVSLKGTTDKIGYLPKGLAAFVVKYFQRSGTYEAKVDLIGTEQFRNAPQVTVYAEIVLAQFPNLDQIPHLSEVSRRLIEVPGVYRIWNTKKQRAYVGSSKDVGKRFKQHLDMLVAVVHYNEELQQDWNDDGPTAFSFELLEVVNGLGLLDRESAHITKQNSFHGGYNATLDGKGRSARGGMVRRAKTSRLDTSAAIENTEPPHSPPISVHYEAPGKGGCLVLLCGAICSILGFRN